MVESAAVSDLNPFALNIVEGLRKGVSVNFRRSPCDSLRVIGQGLKSLGFRDLLLVSWNQSSLKKSASPARHARESGHLEPFEIPGFRVALAIASLPGMTINELLRHHTKKKQQIQTVLLYFLTTYQLF